MMNNGMDGLSELKRCWSADFGTASFRGRIFDPERYLEIAQAKGIIAADYFPAYREEEFE